MTVSKKMQLKLREGKKMILIKNSSGTATISQGKLMI